MFRPRGWGSKYFTFPLFSFIPPDSRRAGGGSCPPMFLPSPAQVAMAFEEAVCDMALWSTGNLGVVGGRLREGRVELGPRNCWTEQNEKLFPIWKVSWRLLLWYAVKHVFHLRHNKSYKHFTLCVKSCVFKGVSFHTECGAFSIRRYLWTFYHPSRSFPWPQSIPRKWTNTFAKWLLGVFWRFVF